MIRSEMFGAAAVKRGVLLLTAMMAVVVPYFATTSSPALAGSENFCDTTLQPYGHSGDRCRGLAHNLSGVNWTTHERAGCADLENGNSELIQSWTCISSNNVGALGPFIPMGNLKGIVRNNNVSSTGYFAATEFF